jgi:hypothetical protein
MFLNLRIVILLRAPWARTLLQGRGNSPVGVVTIQGPTRGTTRAPVQKIVSKFTDTNQDGGAARSGSYRVTSGH